MSRRVETVMVLGLFALALRLAAPEASPPGFNDDELSNTFVINQLVRDGDIRVFYPHASGHEGLYHILAAPLLPLFGPTHVGIRGVSIVCGALAVVLLYLLARRLWGLSAALVAATGLALSFWSLIYSRVGQRHISVTVFALAAFYCWWRGLDEPGANPDPTALRDAEPAKTSRRWSMAWFAASGAVLGLGFYTYFASRGIPLILIALAGYLLLFHRARFARHWRGFVLALALAALIGAPMAVTLSQNPAAEARVDELAAPIKALREGDTSLLVEYGLTTLGMFSYTGDSETLYNIPGRPVFGPVGATFFFIGVAVAVWRWRKPEYLFLLLWTAAGLAPGAMAEPKASLSHTILAQPAVYIFPALGIVWAAGMVRRVPARWTRYALLGLAVVYLGVESVRNLHDYFVVRPQDGYTRVLFHHDFIELARYLDAHPEITDIAIGAQIEERWNQLAFDIALERDDVRARWYDPRVSRLYLFAEGYLALPHYFFEDPAVQYIPYQYGAAIAQIDAYRVFRLPELTRIAPGFNAAFAPGLTLRSADVYPYPGESVYVSTTWQAGESLSLPARPLYSKPPAPDEPDKPRLEVFVHVLAQADGAPAFAAGGLGVDPYTLYAADVFDPWTGARYPAVDGREMVIVGEFEVSGE